MFWKKRNVDSQKDGELEFNPKTGAWHYDPSKVKVDSKKRHPWVNPNPNHKRPDPVK